jgi:hypothetical protein
MKKSIYWVLPVIFLFLVRPSVSRAEGRYVLIVANNQSGDQEDEPLQYADNDGVKFYELYQQAGMECHLLCVPDPNTQRRFPQAAAQARPPTLDNLESALENIFASIQRDKQRGLKTEFRFIYVGHGNVGPNQEGYLHLMDDKLTRPMFFHQILDRSPAAYNHIILDACHSYFLVKKRGSAKKVGPLGAKVRTYLAKEDLQAYPNTGVVLARSSTSETHEWSRWESGIFSHELRSALLGAGDVDGDGQVSYAEAAASVEAANHNIEDHRAKLKVFVHPPLAQVDLPLMDLNQLHGSSFLSIEANQAGRYWLEDTRGVRVADFHHTKEQAIRIALVGKAPFFLRTDKQEATIEAGQRETNLAALHFTPHQSVHRGSAVHNFNQHLYRQAFGLSYLRGFQAILQALIDDPRPAVRISAAAEGNANWRFLSWSSVAVGSALAIGGGALFYLADQSFKEYKASDDPIRTNELKAETEKRWVGAWISSALGVALLATGVTMLLIDDSQEDLHPSMIPTDGGVLMGLGWKY